MAKWYILHTMSGSEKSVEKTLKDQIVRHDMSKYFEEIVVPIVEVPEIRRGKKVMTEKKFMPGYIFIKMKMTDESWHLVKKVTKTKFLGSKEKPEPLSEKEVNAVFNQLENASEVASSASIYSVGDKVQVIDGPFDSFSGVVEEVNAEEQKLKISVSIFGKDTPIELNFTQVKK